MAACGRFDIDGALAGTKKIAEATRPMEEFQGAHNSATFLFHSQFFTLFLISCHRFAQAVHISGAYLRNPGLLLSEQLQIPEAASRQDADHLILRADDSRTTQLHGRSDG